MKKCSKCELNYIKDDCDLCAVCGEQEISKNKTTDDNKNDVELYLIPFLKQLSPEKLNFLTSKDHSFKCFGLRLPLLIKCKNIDKDDCREGIITDSSKTYRYYINAYNINGECSQWATTNNEISKNILQLFQNIDVK